LAIGGSFTGKNTYINQVNTALCASTLDQYGLVLQGNLHTSKTKVNGTATSDKIIATKCAVQASTLDFNKMYSRSMQLSEHFMSLFPSYAMDGLGAVAKIEAQGFYTSDKYQVFTMAAHCNEGCLNANSYFLCTQARMCQIPSQVVSTMRGMLLGDGLWSGPEAKPEGIVVFNVSIS
jgi:hypothetical protein